MLGSTTLFLQSKLIKDFTNIPSSTKNDAAMPQVLSLMKITDAINTYNPRMHVSETRFVDSNCFNLMRLCDSKYFGIITESYPFLTECSHFKEDDEWVEEKENGYILHKAVAYTIIVPSITGSRNIVVAQQVFPSLFTLIKRNLPSPGLTLTDKPVYLIDLMKEKHEKQEKSITRSFVAMDVSGLAVICPFHERFKIPDAYSMTDYIESSSHKQRKVIEADITSKIIRIDTHYPGLFEKPEDSNNKRIEVHGSNEKFFATIILGAFFLAKRLDYRVDISAFQEAFSKLDNWRQQGYTISSKYENLRGLLTYIEKNTERQ